jgi:uncharacterized membrane protein
MKADASAAGIAVFTVAVLAGFGWVLVPAKAAIWALLIAVPGLLWLFLEAGNAEASEAGAAIRRVHRLTIVVLCGIIVADVGPDLAIALGWLDPSGHAVARRARGFLVGAVTLVWGNHLPKLMSPWRLESEPFDWQGVHRFVGRVFAVAGVALMLVWATLPTAAAESAEVFIWLPAIGVSLGRKLVSVLRHSARVA